MSLVLISKSFNDRLALMPSLATAYEGVDFTPQSDIPYQAVSLLPASPNNETMGDRHYKEIGVFQIMLKYPKNNGAGSAMARAELIKSQFKRGTTMAESGLTVVVTNTPTVSPAFYSEDRYCLPISIYYQCEIFI